MLLLLPVTFVLAIAEPESAPAVSDPGVAAPPVAASTDAVDPRWVALVRLREEVATLASDVEADRAAAQADLAALEKRKRDLEGELDAARAKARAVDAQEQALAADAGARAPDADRDAVVAAIRDGRAHLAASIPFDLAARTALLDDAERALTVGSTVQGAELAWRFYARERTLAREVGMAREPITIGDKRVMADVIHVGLVAMYAHTRGGTLAVVTREGDVVRGEPVDAEARPGLQSLFDATKGGPPHGLFMVPR